MSDPNTRVCCTLWVVSTARVFHLVPHSQPLNVFVLLLDRVSL